jgi:glycosyltransferase involved in cell wall biosynthesis
MDPVAVDDAVDFQLAHIVLGLCHQKVEVAVMKILTLLLHDERFSGWTVHDKLFRQHFSVEYLNFCVQKNWEPLLYTFHHKVKSHQTYQLNGASVAKIFPVKFRFPPFLRFGNDHNPNAVMQEMMRDQPDLVHFHNYYMFSFPYTAVFVKKRLKRPLIAQLHGYHNSSARKMLYLPCLHALRKTDHIIYSYKPEESLYRKLKVATRADRVPVPGVNLQVFRRQRRCDSTRLLYVGRVPRPETAYGEKSPLLVLHLLHNLLHEIKNVALDVVGDGPGLEYCRNVASKLGLMDHIVFHGYVPHNDLPKYYQASALTLSPIQVYDVDGWFDGAIQESLACGTPVAALKASPKTPLLGTYGFLLSNNMRRAAAEVSALLKAPEEMDQVAEKGSKFVHENCSYGKVAAELQETWESSIRR